MLVLSGHGELLNPTLYSWRPIIRKKKNKMYHNARLVRKEKKKATGVWKREKPACISQSCGDVSLVELEMRICAFDSVLLRQELDCHVKERFGG
jgi:hypothetical protein